MGTKIMGNKTTILIKGSTSQCSQSAAIVAVNDPVKMQFAAFFEAMVFYINILMAKNGWLYFQVSTNQLGWGM
jgi:hypothetical protein